jgi:hypothetical protein
VVAGKVTMKQRIMTLKTEIFMILLFIMGLTLALGHHAFLSRINGRPTGSTDNQFWIRNAGNAFAHATVICLGTATSIALTQAVSSLLQIAFYPTNVFEVLEGHKTHRPTHQDGRQHVFAAFS